MAFTGRGGKPYMAALVLNHSFDADATRAMGEAFDAACLELHDKGQPVLVREVLAKRIIAAAETGERVPAILRDAALQAAGFKQCLGKPINQRSAAPAAAC
jgi:hypothetical protein